MFVDGLFTINNIKLLDHNVLMYIEAFQLPKYAGQYTFNAICCSSNVDVLWNEKVWILDAICIRTLWSKAIFLDKPYLLTKCIATRKTYVPTKEWCHLRCIITVIVSETILSTRTRNIFCSCYSINAWLIRMQDNVCQQISIWTSRNKFCM